MDGSFWQGKRVLVTGHTGFKGSWLALWLQRCGADVSGLALPPPGTPNLHDSLGLDRLIDGRLVDLRNAEAVVETVRDLRPQVVFHLAAQALVRRSYREPVETFTTNVIGLIHLLEAVRAAGTASVVVNVTSDKCYENRGWDWGYREDDPMGGHDPYSASKGCAELVTASWRRSFLEAEGIVIASARAGNVFGGGDWAEERLVPDLMRAFLAGRPAEIRNPHSVRPWQHVLEPLRGYLTLAQKLWDTPASPRAWNFGPGPSAECPAGEVATRMAALWGDGASWRVTLGVGQPHEESVLRLDASRTAARLGIAPVWSLDEGLAATVEWHKAAMAGDDVLALTARQIERYQSSAEAFTHTKRDIR